MSTTLYLIRHGLPEYPVNNSLQKLMYGPDVPLSKKGEQDAQKLATRLPKFDALYTSPFLRAKQTAQIIANTLGIHTVVEDAAFRDLVYLNAIGMLLDRVLIGSVPAHEHDESAEDVYDRIVKGIDKLRDQHKGKSVGVVFHGHPIRFAVWKYVEGKDTLPKDLDTLTAYNYPLQAEAWALTWDDEGTLIESHLMTRDDNAHPGVAKW